MLKKILIYTQTFSALWKNPDTWNVLGNLEFYAAQHFGADDKGRNKKFVSPENMKESMLERKTLEALVKMRGYLF